MADKKITDLNAATAASGDDLVMIVNDPTGSSPANQKITVQNFFKLPSGTTAEVGAWTNLAAGQLAWISDGNAGAATLGVYDGTDWKVVTIGATASAS